MNSATNHSAETTAFRHVVAAHYAITIAERHVGDGSTPRSRNAAVGITDGLTSCLNGWYRCAAERAVDSLAYSVGVFHPDYAEAKALAVSLRAAGAT